MLLAERVSNIGDIGWRTWFHTIIGRTVGLIGRTEARIRLLSSLSFIFDD